MNTPNPYAAPKTSPCTPAQVRFRDQQLLRQAFLFSIFYFVGLGSVTAVSSGISAVPPEFIDVAEDFTAIWLPELVFVLVPYVLLRSLVISRLARPSWWAFCVAGFATYPFLNLYASLLLRQWDTPSIYNIGAHILSVLSAILTELLAIALFGGLRRLRRNAEPDDARESPSRVY